MDPRETLKRLVADLDKQVAFEILRNWDEIVESCEKMAEIYFDGSAKPNPGKMRIGAVVKCCGNVEEISKEVGNGTNNMAEYLALIEALKVARKMGALAVKAYGDSTLVVEQVNGRWKTKSKELKQLKWEVLELLGRFKRWEIRWIPELENERAHKLANSW